MSELVKVAVSELEGVALDWAVAGLVHAEKWRHEKYCGGPLASINGWNPSIDWAQGGPLIVEKVTVIVDSEEECFADCGYQAYAIKNQRPLDDYDGSGPTMLIACMRAIVSSELGPEVEVPKELVT
ncbi:phage protein NinX family protein [Halomonas sp. BMC6]|uniref:phage protein NinX family protein n=1 Tax=Halomonas sp. BMC6 TaxID=3073244 RepID=UPI0030D28A9F